MADKKKNKSKETIAWEMKQKQEATRKRAFVTDVFFPLLKKHTKTIHQAKQVCKILQNDIMSTFNMGMKNPVSTLDLAKKMEEDTTEGATAYKELLGAFKDLTISEALELIGGMPEAIEGGMSVEDRDRSLDEIDFVDGIMRVKPKYDLVELCKLAQCNDLRQMLDGNWFAYSKKLDSEMVAIRTQGETPEAAVKALIEAIA